MCPQTARWALPADASSCRVATQYKCWCEGSRKKPRRGQEAQQKAQTTVVHRGTSHCPCPRAAPRALDAHQQLENIQLLPQNVLKARLRGARGCEPLSQLLRSPHAPHAAAQQKICGRVLPLGNAGEKSSS